MIKFFRKIRRKLLVENKFSKYLLYAIGEILLVIIGILIALSINQKSEQKQIDAKIDTIFVDILGELGENIGNINALIRFYQVKDSVFHLVLNDKLTYDDYKNTKIPGFYSATTLYANCVVNRNVYDNLVLNMDAINPKYNSIVS